MQDDHEDECINCSQDIDWKFIANVRKNIEDNIDNPALTVDVLCNLMGEPYQLLQQTQGIDRSGSGRLHPPDPPETFGEVAERRYTQYNRNSRNDRI